MKVKDKSTFVLVDDQPLLRGALRHLIEKQKFWEVLDECDTLASLRTSLEKKNPDLVILDLAVSDCDGPGSIKALIDRWPNLKILVLTAKNEASFATRCIKAKARGYVMKRESTDVIMAAISTVVAGAIWVSEQVKTSIIEGMAEGKTQSDSPLESLTNREMFIFQMLGQGVPSRSISKKLNISVKTVEAHMANLKKKLNQANNKQLLRTATLWMDRETKGQF